MTHSGRRKDNDINVLCDTCSGLAIFIIDSVIAFSGKYELFAAKNIHHHFIVVDRETDPTSMIVRPGAPSVSLLTSGKPSTSGMRGLREDACWRHTTSSTGSIGTPRSTTTPLEVSSSKQVKSPGRNDNHWGYLIPAMAGS